MSNADGRDPGRMIRLSDDLWDRLGQAAMREARRLGVRVSRSDIVRQGAAQRVEAILTEASDHA